MARGDKAVVQRMQSVPRQLGSLHSQDKQNQLLRVHGEQLIGDRATELLDRKMWR